MSNKLRRTSTIRKKSARRKAQRLLLERSQKELAKATKPNLGPRPLDIYVRAGVLTSKKGDKRAVFSFRPALLANPGVVPAYLDDADLVGMLEDPKEFGEFLVGLGLRTLSALMGVKLGPETKLGDVVEALVNWMAVDLVALKKAAEQPTEAAPAELAAAAPVEEAPQSAGTLAPLDEVGP